MLNKVILIGNVGADPDIRNLDSGAKVATIRLATNEYYKESKHTEWHTVVAWRKLAELAENYIHKGTLIYVEGRIRRREYEDKDGNKRYSFEIMADAIRLLGKNTVEQTPQQKENKPNSADDFMAEEPEKFDDIVSDSSEEDDDLPF